MLLLEVPLDQPEEQRLPRPTRSAGQAEEARDGTDRQRVLDSGPALTRGCRSPISKPSRPSTPGCSRPWRGASAGVVTSPCFRTSSRRSGWPSGSGSRLGTTSGIPAPICIRWPFATSLAVIRRYQPQCEDLHAEPPELPRAQAPALGRLLPAERARLVEELVQKLEPDAARAIRGYLTGLNHEELAGLYGWSHSVARHLVYRSLEQLRKRLGESTDDE